jgi:tetratricopeptide (TPR) repeat protein
MNKFTAGVILLAVACTGSIVWSTTSYMRSNWRVYEQKSDATLSAQPQNLQKAEDELMKAIEVAFKDKVPEKEIVHVYEKMGDLMMREGKYEDAQKYFLRTVQFNNALHVETDQNIAQLKKLETAYEKARDYDNASQTQTVLVTLLEIEKSPSDPTYAAEKQKRDELKLRLARFENPEGIPKVKVADHVTTPQEQKQQESMLTGWH